ncbi:MAG: MFS transporter [Chloroflexota bacterium]|nr:MFS transporter [Chloroflexota bacterium]MDE3194591.1 MFS transporter [Chloroflexota bacterium]
MIPPVFRYGGFRLFWLGIAFSAIGTQATAAANLWQIQDITDSTLAVGIVSLLQGISVIFLGPLGGGLADRWDRRRLLQAAQASSLLSSVLLAALTFTHHIAPAWIYVAGTVVAAAATFDGPARQSLVPAVVPKERVVDAFALLIPAQQLARFAGPAIAGILIALWGAGAVYTFDVVTYVALIVTLGFIGFEKMEPRVPQPLTHAIVEGFEYVRGRPLIWQLISLDVSATFFAAYRVVLPALARDVFAVGAAGYGLLSAAPAVGAIFGSGIVYRLRTMRRKGVLVLAATTAYAVCAALLGYVPAFAVAVVVTAALGFFDAVAQTIRQAVVQVETPDRLRGRVTSVYQMASRGGPALGQAQLGAVASVVGPQLGLAVGGALCFAYAAWLALTGTTVRRYEG